MTRCVTITSGEMYPESGIFRRVRWTRLVADKRRPGRAGNGMRLSSRYCRRGADPPRNPSGRAGGGGLSVKVSKVSWTSAGNGFCIAAANRCNCELEK